MKKIIIFFSILTFLFSYDALAITSTPPTPAQIAEQLSIKSLKIRSYPGSDIKIEQTLTSTAKYFRYVASYQSEGLKINGLLTVPKGKKPTAGWPAIIFNHGYVTPEVYTTDKRYAAYVDAFAKKGYVVFKSDYRGHAQSEGLPEGVYYSPAYTIDVMNALASIKKYPDINPNKIGMWGHSMGGHITLNAMVIDPKDIKAAVIWGGVVAPYVDIMYHWPDNNPGVPFVPSTRDVSVKLGYRKQLLDTFGSPLTNPKFWATLDATSFIKEIKTPIQLQTGGKDLDVPVAFSLGFVKKLKAAKKTVIYYNYPGGNHNISAPNFDKAMARSVAFFDKYLK